MKDKVKKIKNDLQQFSGTTVFHLMPTVKSRFTDGLKYLCEVARCYWLISDATIVCDSLKTKSYFITVDFKRFSKKEQVQEQCEAIIYYSDGNNNVLQSQKYQTTDFPLDELRLFYVNDTLMLPGEY